MELVNKIHKEIATKNMLIHPFYQDWLKGSLTKKQLQHYALQYIPFTDAFPRFVSAIHSKCPSTKGRQMLLENLMDEEGAADVPPHPKMWRNFISGLGGKESEDLQFGRKAVQLRERFFELCDKSYETGLVALYIYEHQIPKVAKLKVEGLAKHYNMSEEKSIKFFTHHEKADLFHSKTCEELINHIDNKMENTVLDAAEDAASALWDFLSEVYQKAA